MLSKFKEKFLNKKKSESDNENESVPSDFFIAKVLIVDDVLINRYIIKKYIEKVRPDIEIHEASNGLTAIELNDTHHFDMIFMDIKLPGIDGIETTKRIKKTDTHAIVIGSTGQVEREIISKCLAVGMKRVLGKPIDKKEIEYILNGGNDSIYN